MLDQDDWIRPPGFTSWGPFLFVNFSFFFPLTLDLHLPMTLQYVV